MKTILLTLSDLFPFLRGRDPSEQLREDADRRMREILNPPVDESLQHLLRDLERHNYNYNPNPYDGYRFYQEEDPYPELIERIDDSANEILNNTPQNVETIIHFESHVEAHQHEFAVGNNVPNDIEINIENDINAEIHQADFANPDNLFNDVQIDIVETGDSAPFPNDNPVQIGDFAQKLLNNNQQDNAISPFLPLVSIVKKLSEGAFKIIPFFLWALYTSKEELLQNVNVMIKATKNSKVYQIGLGVKNDREVSIAFEVIAGQPIRFLHDKDASTSTEMPDPIFTPLSSIKAKVLGPIKHLIWKREEPWTNGNISVEDVGNPLLKNGPLRAFFKTSEREGFYILHFDPTVTPDPAEASDFVISGEHSHWSSHKAVTVKVTDPISPNEEHRRQEIFLPFDEKQKDRYLCISQWISV